MSTERGFEYGMDGPKLILAGADGSDTSLRALAYAAGLARRQGSQLLVAYVAGGRGVGSIVPGYAAAVLETDEEIAAELRGLLTDRAAQIGVAYEFVVRHGEAGAELAKLADERRADAIVVGASTQAGHRLVGSLAVRLVRAGRWPVTVVP